MKKKNAADFSAASVVCRLPKAAGGGAKISARLGKIGHLAVISCFYG